METRKKISLTEFIEEFCGYNLTAWQKELLKKYEKLPPDCKLIYCGGKFHIVKNDELPESKAPVPVCESRLRGLHSKIPAIYDELHKCGFEPEIIYEKEGGIKIREMSIVPQIKGEDL